MIPIKNSREIEKIRIAGKRLKSVFEEVAPVLKVGINTYQIDKLIEDLLVKNELKAECKGYGGYPCVSCISVNDVVVHGIPRKEIVLKDGDFVKIDVVGSFKGYCADMARGFFIGNCSEQVFELERVAREAFYIGIAKIKSGIRLSNISHEIERFVLSNNFAIVKEFAGHGIGKKMHEEPEIPNFGPSGKGPILMEGMVLAIEPMITELPCDVVIDKDGWTARTKTGVLAAHFENTILITKSGVEIITD